MNATILHLPNGGKHVVRPKTETIATGAPVDGKTPLFELGLPEILIVRGYIERSIEDVRFQLEKESRRLSKKQFAEIKLGAMMITNWLLAQIIEIDKMLADFLVEPPSDTEKT